MSIVAHGAVGLIKVNGRVIGKVQDISVTEDEQRTDVYGIGEVIPSESPVVRWSGRLTVSFMEVDFSNGGIPGAIRRDVQTNQEFVDQLLFSTQGVQIDIFKKIEDFIDPDNGLIRGKLKPFAIAKRCLITSDSFNMAEGSVVRRNQSFNMLEPLTYPK